jgi:hypothetical protein
MKEYSTRCRRLQETDARGAGNRRTQESGVGLQSWCVQF